MTIQELFQKELSYWHDQNVKLFGVGLLDETNPFPVLNDQLKEYADQYWNTESPCYLATKLNDGTLDKESELRLHNSYQFVLNPYNLCIDVLGDYQVGEAVKTCKICAIPTPSTSLSWIINKCHYVARVAAKKDFIFKITREYKLNTVETYPWLYNSDTETFTSKPDGEVLKIEDVFNGLSKREFCLLQSCLEEPLTVDNFKEALDLLPIFDSNSIFNYQFSRLEYFKELIDHSGQYARPTKGNILGINRIFVSKVKKTRRGSSEGCLVRSTSKIFALENFRTVVNVFNAEYKPAFTYTDTIGFFDVFKTVTSLEAGRQRLLLDNVVLNDGMLFVQENGKEINMFESLKNLQSKRLSCLSEAPFCNNDKPKRIMMNAKLTSQAVPLKDEIDDLTHRILARVVFADIEGYSCADSIIISESFAERLRTYSTDICYLDKSDPLLNQLDTVNYNVLKQLYPNTHPAILKNYEHVKVDHTEDLGDVVRVFLSWSIPFRLGDKISNLHGAKGTVGKILPDHEMPKLLNKVGILEPGAFDVVISGFSTIRRGSLGQIFEAWMLGSGLGGISLISQAIDQYKDQMLECGQNSVVEYNGERTISPVGINYIMRVYHHAATHLSTSGKFAYKKLKLGEMEKLHLVSSDCYNILKELSIRSITKHYGAFNGIEVMEHTGEFPEELPLNLKFSNIMRSLGYNVKLSGRSLLKSNLSDIELSEDDETILNGLGIY